jgi:hypothetical protein
VDLDWYRVGYRHEFVLGERGEWRLWPSVGVAVWDFHYRLSGSAGGEAADRSYIKANAQLGIEAEWRPGWGRGRFAISAAVLATPPVPSWPQIYTEQIVVKYRVLDRPFVDLDLFGGVAFEQQYYEDNQTVPNRIQAEFGPMVILGIDLRF